MTNKKILMGMLAVLLSFGMMVIGCGDGGGGEPEPPPATASVSISMTDISRVYLFLSHSNAEWTCHSDGFAAGAADGNAYLKKLFSWITITDKNGNALGEVRQISADHFSYGFVSVANSVKRMLVYEIRGGSNINLDDLKPITATLNTSKLEEMKEYTNVTGSLTAGYKTSETLE